MCDCEPLHDIKGHLANLFTELPYIIEDAHLRNETVQLLEIVVPKEKPSGGDYRQAAVRLLSLITGRAPEDICLLMSTIVEISEILYAPEEKRNTVSILRLNNLTWVHHELCRQLLHNLHKLSRQKLFGLYLHALSCHAPKQYEVMCLKSCNAENEERLFGQAKAIALSTTNRRPGNILPNILLRLQAKQQQSEMFKAQNHLSNTISREARAVYKSKNAKISVQYISERLDSWQAHLEDISRYLAEGEGAWWKCTDHGEAIEFLDVESDGEHHDQPKLQNYRTVGLAEVKLAKVEAWKKVLNLNIPLPTPSLKLYDSDGNFLSRKIFPMFANSAQESISDENSTNIATEADASPPNLDEPNHLHVSNNEECTPTECASTTVNVPVCLEDVYDHQSASDSEPSTSSRTSTTEHVPVLQTKLARALHKCLKPDTEDKTFRDIQELDKLRHQLKCSGSKHAHIHVSTIIRSRYNIFVDNLLQKISALKDRKIQEIQSFEKSYFLANKALPERQANVEYESMIHEKNFVSKLLQLTSHDARI